MTSGQRHNRTRLCATPAVLQQPCARVRVMCRACLVGASKYSVPLIMTRCAGVLTPHARVLVATSTCTPAFPITQALTGVIQRSQAQ